MGMSAELLDGRRLAAQLRNEFKDRVMAMVDRLGRPPGLSVILVGDNAASAVYVGNKIKACESVGIKSDVHRLAADMSAQAVIDLIHRLNADEATDGILVQLPLPAHHNLNEILHAISVDKDVDGFHLYNVGGLVAGETVFSPCTPYGVTKLLDSAGINVTGKNVVVVGASNIVGKPMALMMMKREATVTVCHAKTRDLGQFTILADILIVAAGVPRLIVPQMVKHGAVVIDVGINRLPDGSLSGDVDFEGVREKASHITPVPGGVGPMTVTMLLSNTIASAERKEARSKGVAPADIDEMLF
jgi:methylenetetrahydrofolate dehydrogenase (NADP+)/methenyltetrahydrofolate cyclohydrolase